MAGFSPLGVSAMHQMLKPTIAAVAVDVEGFIAAQKDMSAVVEKMQGAASPDKPSSKYDAEIEAVTKKHGFKNFAEYEAVAANISMVMAAIDPQTKAFTDPQTAIKKEIEDVSADKTIPDNEKKQ